MLVSLKVPDEVFESYGKHNPQNPRLAMEQALKRFSDIAPNRKAIILTGDDLAKVQEILSVVLEGPSDFMAALRKALTIDVEGVEVAFTESQRKAIVDTARYIGIEPKELIPTKVREGIVKAFGV